MNIDVLQIGANVGNTDNDPVYPRVLSGEFKNGILVEANPKCIPILKKNYEGLGDFLVLNLAVASQAGEIDFYVDNIDKGEGTSQHSSPSLSFQHAHQHKNEEITTLRVTAAKLEDICREHGVELVSWLFVDTEGYDFEILFNTDFSKLNVKNIYFESSHTDGAHNQGQNYEKLISKLDSYGYRLENKTTDNAHLCKK